MRLIPIILVFTYFQCFSQNVVYDSLYNKITKDLLPSYPVKALVSTEELEKISKNEFEKARSLMLRAFILGQYGLKNEALKVALDADRIATNDFYKAHLNRLLSTLYRESGFLVIGEKALDKAIEISETINENDDTYKLEGMLFQERAYYSMEEGNYQMAIENLNRGKNSFNKIENIKVRLFRLAESNQQIGQNHLRLQKADSAFFYFRKARTELINSEYFKSPLRGCIYNGLGEAYLLKGDHENARLNLEKALEIAEASNFHYLKIEIYKTLLDYYNAIGDSENYIRKNDLLKELTVMEEQNRKGIAKQLLQSIEENQQEMKIGHKNTIIIIVSSSLLTILLILTFFLYRKKRAFKYVANPIPNNESFSKLKDKSSINKSHIYINIPKRTEDYILGKLEQFENSRDFLDKRISLTTLAAKIVINTRYLSHVIKEHKHTDFTTYINELRIDYIVDRLEKDPEYLQYKISYLADICGFSSHTRFSVTFKKVTGQPPSSFIESLKDNTVDKIGIQ